MVDMWQGLLAVYWADSPAKIVYRNKVGLKIQICNLAVVTTKFSSNYGLHHFPLQIKCMSCHLLSMSQEHNLNYGQRIYHLPPRVASLASLTCTKAKFNRYSYWQPIRNCIWKSVLSNMDVNIDIHSNVSPWCCWDTSPFRETHRIKEELACLLCRT